MALLIIFKREFRDTLWSKRFLLYAALMLLSVAISTWFSHVLNENPIAFGGVLPESITPIHPIHTFDMMVLMDVIGLPIVLIAVLQGGDFIAGEQSRGILLLFSTKPVHRWEIILGKYLSFAVLFIPLIAISLGCYTLAIAAIGSGWTSGNVFLGYLLYQGIIGMVFLSISTLFSSITRSSIMASLAALIFVVIWGGLETIIMFLGGSTTHVLKYFSLMHYASDILSYVSEGNALLIGQRGILATVSTGELLQSTLIILLLIITPVVISVRLLGRRDIHGQ
ncbi:ABC transporter permease [Chloroflexota bacterium]